MTECFFFLKANQKIIVWLHNGDEVGKKSSFEAKLYERLEDF